MPTSLTLAKSARRTNLTRPRTEFDFELTRVGAESEDPAVFQAANHRGSLRASPSRKAFDYEGSSVVSLLRRYQHHISCSVDSSEGYAVYINRRHLMAASMYSRVPQLAFGCGVLWALGCSVCFHFAAFRLLRVSASLL